MFQHHPDGVIIINGVMFPLPFFLLMQPDYSLPEGYIGRTYVPNETHQVFNSGSSLPQPLVWAAGDQYIAHQSQYSLAYQRLQNRKLAGNNNPLKRRVRPLWQ